MPRPTMAEMRERVKIAREAARPKAWEVDVETRVTFKKNIEVEAANEDDARAAAQEEVDYWGITVGDDDYEECEYDETDLHVRRKE